MGESKLIIKCTPQQLLRIIELTGGNTDFFKEHIKDGCTAKWERELSEQQMDILIEKIFDQESSAQQQTDILIEKIFNQKSPVQEPADKGIEDVKKKINRNMNKVIARNTILLAFWILYILVTLFTCVA